MIRAFNWLLWKCPNLVLMFAGLWVASCPIAFGQYHKMIEVYIRNPGTFPGKDVLRRIYVLCNDFEALIIVAQLFFLGIGVAMAVTGAMRIVRYWASSVVKRLAANPDAPSESN